MSHNPEQDAAAYLGGALPEKKARRFEEHLLECQECWNEVTLARRGRVLSESAREIAPQALREHVRVSVESEPVTSPTPRLQWAGAAGLAVAVVIAVVGLLIRAPAPGPGAIRQPDPVAQAIVDFQDRRVPAEGTTTHEAPDLTEIGFQIAGAGSGEIGELKVDGFAYLDATGRRLQIYVADEPFPEAVGAKSWSGPDSPWTASAQGIQILCADSPLRLLALSDRPEVLQAVSAYLKMS